MLPQNIIWGNKARNLDTLAEALNLIHPEADLLILPETFSTGFPSGDKESIRPLAERNTGKTIDFVKELALRHNIAIAGSFIADSGGSLYNRAFFIEPSGDETYADKRHLFTMAGEDKSFSHGYERMKVRYRGWNIAMVICYDIRFPVWCRNVGNEYDLLIAVANWPKVRVNAWNQLLIARAIENECYVCGVDCCGTDSKGFEYNGSSMAVDFKGKIISTPGPAVPVRGAEGADNIYDASSQILYATLDHDKLDAFREKFPAWRDADSFNLTTD